MLAGTVLTCASALKMKEQREVSQPQSPADAGLTSASTSTSASSTPPPVAGNNSTVAQQSSTSAEAASVNVSRNARGERDSSWLELEACREHLRQACPRQAEECRYAHPEPRIYVKDGRVTCCYDFLKVNPFLLLVQKVS